MNKKDSPHKNKESLPCRAVSLIAAAMRSLKRQRHNVASLFRARIRPQSTAATTHDDRPTEPKSSTVRNLRCPTLRRVTRNFSRFYEVEGYNELYPSVTSVLGVLDKPGIKNWAVGQTIRHAVDELVDVQDQAGDRPLTLDEISKAVHQSKEASTKELNRAGDFGTRAHDAIDHLIAGKRGKEVNIDLDVKPVVDNFWDWWVSSGVTLDPRGDTMVYSPRYGYAGALDALAMTPDGQLMVCDWKTSNSVYESHIIQVAAYAKAVEENLLACGFSPEESKVHRACVVRFEKNKQGFEVHEVDNIDAAFGAFKAALYLFHFTSKLKAESRERWLKSKAKR